MSTQTMLGQDSAGPGPILGLTRRDRLVWPPTPCHVSSKPSTARKEKADPGTALAEVSSQSSPRRRWPVPGGVDKGLSHPPAPSSWL